MTSARKEQGKAPSRLLFYGGGALAGLAGMFLFDKFILNSVLMNTALHGTIFNANDMGSRVGAGSTYVLASGAGVFGGDLLWRYLKER